MELRRQNNSNLVLKDATAAIDLEKYRGYNQCKRFLTATGLFYRIPNPYTNIPIIAHHNISGEEPLSMEEFDELLLHLDNGPNDLNLDDILKLISSE